MSLEHVSGSPSSHAATDARMIYQKIMSRTFEIPVEIANIQTSHNICKFCIKMNKLPNNKEDKTTTDVAVDMSAPLI